MAEQALKNGETEEPDFDVVEEGSEEAKKLTAGGKVDDQDDDEGDDGDAKLTSHAGDAKTGDAAGGGGTDKAAKRKRQRQRLKEQLTHKDSIIRSQAQQLRQVNDRLGIIERRTGANELVMIDKAISDTRSLVENAAAAHSHALTTGDPNLVTTAMGNLYDAKRQLEGLETLKVQASHARSAPQATDQGVARNVNAWMARNSWFRPETGDEDSLIAKVIDNKLADEGYNPATTEYWDELDRRINKRLPHRASSKSDGGGDDEGDDEGGGDDDAAQRQTRQNKNAQAQGGRSNVSGSGQGAGAPTRVKVVISKERVQALKDAGMWEDTKQRNKMIRQYQEFDRANGAN